MSKFFVPDGLMPDARTMEASLKKISQDMEAMQPKGFGGDAASASMFAAPAAFMALGAGMAGQAFGFWLKAAFGTPMTTGAEAPYSHEFQSGSWTLPSMSIETGMPEVPRRLRIKPVGWNADSDCLLLAA